MENNTTENNTLNGKLHLQSNGNVILKNEGAIPTSNESSSTNNSTIEQNHPDSDMKTWEEVSISVPWGLVCGKWWGPRNKQPIIAIHGWQDNAGTFDRLIPLLTPKHPVLCIDLPGHGKSSKYPQGMHYYLFWDGISLIRRIVRKHQWKNVILLGHSLGGALAFMYAACFPNEVDKYISIDIPGPSVRCLKKQAAITGHSIDKFLDYEELPESKIPSYTYNEVIELVLHAYDGSVDKQGVEILMKRGMNPVPQHLDREGYAFARDLRLKVSGLGMFSKEQVLSYAERIKCKVLNIRAEPGMKFDVYDEIIDHIKTSAEVVIMHKVPGTHHIHLVNPERIYKFINEFLEM
ncbi:probable serine hydrolase [Condylostylus longicornis]|uniref:probable serine hydrolase n=1 Tax=Condylostylus longicornis TaxID=2530218 RepID=UPI00244E4470|nr:probable serine hydrolase [Condylostylus longicornis]